MKKDVYELTDAQFALARKIESAGIDTISQIVKAFARKDNAKIEHYKSELKRIESAQQK